MAQAQALAQTRQTSASTVISMSDTLLAAKVLSPRYRTVVPDASKETHLRAGPKVYPHRTPGFHGRRIR
jgi:hypothetical protein